MVTHVFLEVCRKAPTRVKEWYYVEWYRKIEELENHDTKKMCLNNSKFTFIFVNFRLD